MINRRFRFHGYGSLRRAYREGRVTRGPFFAVKCVENPRRSDYRLAVVVSRKVSKSAVVRNRIRRRLYEAVRQLQPAVEGPYDIVITVFNDQLVDEPQKNLEAQLKRQLHQAGLLVASRKA